MMRKDQKRSLQAFGGGESVMRQTAGLLFRRDATDGGYSDRKNSSSASETSERA
jgi:hypothetical protein